MIYRRESPDSCGGRRHAEPELSQGSAWTTIPEALEVLMFVGIDVAKAELVVSVTESGTLHGHQ